MTRILSAALGLSLCGALACGGTAGSGSGGGAGGSGGGEAASGGGSASSGGGSASSGGGASSAGGGASSSGGGSGASGGGTSGAGGGASASGGGAGATGGGSGSSGGGSAASGGGTSSSGGGAAGGGSGFTDGGVSLAMTFFVTSRGMGTGGDLRGDAGTGLEGADRFCVSLAGAVSPVLGAKNWKAYLSTTTTTARSRVGQGPWVNAKGVQIAANVNQLHDDVGTNTLSYDNALDETGTKVPTGGSTGANVHDILTGSTLDGGLSVGANCNDWTSATGANSVRVGHCNRAGGGQFPTSWNSAHTLTSCTEQGVKAGGGRGSFYCFVSN